MSFRVLGASPAVLFWEWWTPLSRQRVPAEHGDPRATLSLLKAQFPSGMGSAAVLVLAGLLAPQQWN